MISIEALKHSLNSLRSPFSKKDEGLVESGMIESLTLKDTKIICVLSVPVSQKELKEETSFVVKNLVADIKEHLRKEAPLLESVVIPTNAISFDDAQNLRPWGVRHVKWIIAVASGKGGVGKSTVSVNLALALEHLGLKVGILDADVYGPSLSHLLRIHKAPRALEGKRFQPVLKGSMALMSMAFLMKTEAPLIWRGPMVQGVLQQMLEDVDWGDLDILVVDLPPGTGDAHLTLVQKVTLSGALIVSTPQDIALIDARKAIAMFQKLNVPLLGIIENMSLFTCSHCGHESAIFSHGGARKEAEKCSVPFLGEIPLDLKIREASDAGQPLSSDSKEGEIFAKLAQHVVKKLEKMDNAH